MGSSARHRAARKKSKQSAPSTPQAAWGSASPTPNFDPASRSQLLQGWRSFSDQEQTFTLNQEARNTHRSAWNESNRLRDKAIQFVSGGKLRQEDPNTGDGDGDNATKPVSSAEEKDDIPSLGLDEINHQLHTQREDETVALVDAERVSSLTRQVEQMDPSFSKSGNSTNRRRTASESSTSSEEIILFAGRGNPAKAKEQPLISLKPEVSRPAPLEPSSSQKTSTSRLPQITTPSRLNPGAKDFIPVMKAEPGSKDAFQPREFVRSRGRQNGLNGQKQQAGGKKSKIQGRQLNDPLSENDDGEEETLRDYIENMKANQELGDEFLPEQNEHHRNHGGSGLENAKVKISSSKSKTKYASKRPGDDWSSDDLRDFEDFDTSDDDLIDIGGVFSRRQRSTGLQYLVTPVGQSTDFAKWILREKLTSTTAAELIVNFEKTHPSDPDSAYDEDGDENQWIESSSSDSEEEAIDDVLRDQESEDLENERVLRQTSRMTDAELARILNKQAELGISNDDVVLFDAGFEEEDDFIPFSAKMHTSNRTRSKQNRRSKGTFPSAEAFADALDQDPYNGFDVMDFDRPSLKQKKKGRKSATGLPFELEDEEVAEQLAQSWANDRAKKAVKKAEREELRQAGLLGPKSGKGRVDLQTKYRNCGMDMDQVKAELRIFLLNDDREALALAPMNSPQRRQVHILAKALNLKSHSQGKGDTRFPILAKTPFSGRYDEDNIGEIDALLSMRKFSSRQWGVKKERPGPRPSGGGARRNGGGGGVASGATYMDGDVVGASAPELGTENKGRAMLEKMGWSSGMGIGKVGNKGSVEVIKHVVKNSKAGLG